MISFLVALNTKITERGDVVNIQFASMFLFCDAAPLACIVIALSCCPALWVPVGAIVRNTTALPVRAIRAAQSRQMVVFGRVLALPLGFTLYVAELAPALVNLTRHADEFLSALLADALDLAKSWVIRTRVVLRLPLAKAGHRAESLSLLASGSDFLTAELTKYRGLFRRAPATGAFARTILARPRAVIPKSLATPGAVRPDMGVLHLAFPGAKPFASSGSEG